MKNREGPEVVVITGASAGIGRATARAFAKTGAHIALLARDRARLDKARDEVEQLGGKAICIPIDMADADQVDAAAARVERELGPIDIWVNNAMATIFSPSTRSPAKTTAGLPRSPIMASCGAPWQR